MPLVVAGVNQSVVLESKAATVRGGDVFAAAQGQQVDVMAILSGSGVVDTGEAANEFPIHHEELLPNNEQQRGNLRTYDRTCVNVGNTGDLFGSTPLVCTIVCTIGFE